MTFDYRKNFSWQYRWVQKIIHDPTLFHKDWQDIISASKRMMTASGFAHEEANVLQRIRTKASSINPNYKTSDVAVNLLEAVNVPLNSTVNLLPAAQSINVSALKFLMHMYFETSSGERSVWVHSLPQEFSNWCSLQFYEKISAISSATSLLRSNSEHFTPRERMELANASGMALAWAQRTIIILANALNQKSEEHSTSLELIRRWFGDSSCTDQDLMQFALILSTGFKAMIATLTRGKLIFTDFISLREASTSEEIRFFKSEAFVISNRFEGMDIVYIEQAFFNPPPGGLLNGPKNWARVILHELSHLDAKTIDVPYGSYARYAWAGIAPHAGFPGKEAIQNADSWAFFAADCAQALTEGERIKALRIT
ncbi:M35 family metallo-endopeptidase [Massilia sp. W12]|uniref:M35 family metallo-endopeptidase n=1 Tax=Massilia sp. W12 TaxID=3126507 RepID=UPI0030D227AA